MFGVGFSLYSLHHPLGGDLGAIPYLDFDDCSVYWRAPRVRKLGRAPVRLPRLSNRSINQQRRRRQVAREHRVLIKP